MITNTSSNLAKSLYVIVIEASTESNAIMTEETVTRCCNHLCYRVHTQFHKHFMQHTYYKIMNSK